MDWGSENPLWAMLVGAGGGMLSAGPGQSQVGGGLHGLLAGYNLADSMQTRKRQRERDDYVMARQREMDRLRDTAILEARTAGLPIPSAAAGQAMAGQMPRGMLHAPASPPPAAMAGLQEAVARATGFPVPDRVEQTGYGAQGPRPRDDLGAQGPRNPGSIISVLAGDTVPLNPVTGSKTTGAARDGATFQPQTSGAPPATVPGLSPAMRDYLIANNPATYAQMQTAASRPHVLSRGSKMVDGTGRVIAEGASPFPQVRNFTIGSETVPHQYDEASGQWVPLDGMGGPRFSPRYRGELTPAQQRDNIAIEVARTQLESMGLNTPEAIKEASTEYLPTGRPNPRFNRGVASLVKRATTRMTGEDPGYETVIASVYGGQRPQAGAQPASTPGIASRPERPAISMPTTSAGSIDAARLKHGQTYELPDGRRVRWDSMRKGFEVIQ